MTVGLIGSDATEPEGKDGASVDSLSSHDDCLPRLREEASVGDSLLEEFTGRALDLELSLTCACFDSSSMAWMISRCSTIWVETAL